MTVKNDRFSAIRQRLYKSGYSTIQEIAYAVSASPAIIRRDLLVLEQQGFISRNHGGAQIAEDAGGEVAFAIREQHNLAAKRYIAEAAFARLKPGSAIFLDAGTTVLQLARRIRLNPLPLSIFTNCVTLAQLLMDVGELKITLLGGRLRPENASMVGSLAEAALDRLRFEQLFMGAGAIAEDNCVYTQDEEEARLNEKMLSRATKVTLLVDSSKFGQRSTYKVARLNDEMDVITDQNLPESWTLKLQETGCRVQQVAKKNECYPGHPG
ncbi:transcriptional regulator, DeoR family protein [Candidatus Sodalis pierantonius str. SOPE]|uniref:Transcriptional regulator, DeoR family protein n=1 Tax=Candidatus Sodalis pierantonii str. SOPE TaxID=2342 RepID=W0HR28_9GAMM|nr:DeoR/GlpR family DNA-binding transcription regulator [Candidatus Sodalis pierantonius]AHF74952.1 transcriptional regulator, DeoR family protein [Candidatus Sodalis pierantonius str. SOPE]